MLQEPSEEEVRLFSPWRYAKNFASLHTDTDVMPSSRRAWAAWTYQRETDATLQEPAAVTWHVNRLQGLPNRDQYFVTFNRVRPIPAHHVIKEMYFTHPVLTREAVDTQKDLPKLNGTGPLHYCGSYFGKGFHEDAVKSAFEVARIFGQELEGEGPGLSGP
jgi:predicted NAD/FAD-binding protein